MVELRKFLTDDIHDLKENKYADMSCSDIETMIQEWNLKVYKGKKFETLAVVSKGIPIGYLSFLQGDTIDTVHLGIEIFLPFRYQGYGTEAVKCGMAYAKQCGYKRACVQIHVDNCSSISLHKKLGFTQTLMTTNKKGNNVYLMETVL